MQDKSIDGALIALRKSIIRGNLDGLAHVEALLTIRCVPMPRVMPAKRPDAALRGHISRLVIDALRGGPMTLRALSDRVAEARPEIGPRAAYIRTGQVLARLKLADKVRRNGRMWGLRL